MLGITTLSLETTQHTNARPAPACAVD